MLRRMNEIRFESRLIEKRNVPNPQSERMEKKRAQCRRQDSDDGNSLDARRPSSCRSSPVEWEGAKHGDGWMGSRYQRRCDEKQYFMLQHVGAKEPITKSMEW